MASSYVVFNQIQKCLGYVEFTQMLPKFSRHADFLWILLVFHSIECSFYKINTFFLEPQTQQLEVLLYVFFLHSDEMRKRVKTCSELPFLASSQRTFDVKLQLRFEFQKAAKGSPISTTPSIPACPRWPISFDKVQKL